MFGLGVPELVIILVIALIIFGPKKLPEVGKALGKSIREFKQSADGIKKDIETGVGLDEKSKEDLKSAISVDESPKENSPTEAKVSS